MKNRIQSVLLFLALVVISGVTPWFSVGQKTSCTELLSNAPDIRLPHDCTFALTATRSLQLEIAASGNLRILEDNMPVLTLRNDAGTVDDPGVLPAVDILDHADSNKIKSNAVILQDVDDDGYTDLKIMSWQGTSENGYNVFRYDTSVHEFRLEESSRDTGETASEKVL